MPKPNSFILSSDFPTMKNDSSALGSGTISSGIAIAGNSYITSFGDVTIGKVGALARGRISSSKNSNIFYTGNNTAFQRTGSQGIYTVYAFMFRVTPTSLRFQIYIPNPYSVAMTGEAGIDTINFKVNTFIPPFA